MSQLGHERRIKANAPAAGRPQTADSAGGQGGFRLGSRIAFGQITMLSTTEISQVKLVDLAC